MVLLQISTGPRATHEARPIVMPEEIHVLSTDGQLEVSSEVQRTLRLRQGARVRLSIEDGIITLRSDAPPRSVDKGRPRWTDIRPARMTEGVSPRRRLIFPGECTSFRPALQDN
jgi:hypothetical protein